MSQSRLLARAAVLVALLVAALSLSVVPEASAVTSRKPLNDTRPVGSAPVVVDFPIEYFGVVAELSSPRRGPAEHGRAPYGEARFRVGGRWTEWQALGQDGAQAPGQFTGALLSVDRADAYQVRGLPAGGRNWRAAAINTTDGPSVVVGHRRSDAATAAPACMSRADWGADESLSEWGNGATQAYHPVQVLTVHHTAGSNDLGQDYAATVRAIYSYHVETNHFADIGYQYLVDGHGTVYEGRSSGHTSASCLYAGGDGSDFAHEPTTDEVVTGAHVGDNNSGNAGIALMGCYEPASTTCEGDTTPPYAAVDSLENQLASLSTRHGLDPEGGVHYDNPESDATKDVATISGHLDWGDTECPGGELYEQLPMIRTNVASRMAGTSPSNPPAVVSFRRESRSVAENAGTVELAVTRGGNTERSASVSFALASGTATPDSDFTLTPGTLDFAAGEVDKKIEVSIRDDRAREGLETVVVSLGPPAAGTVLRSPASMTVAIGASDQRPDAWISTASSSGYVGNDVYNTTGYRQTRTLSARRTQRRTFYVRVYNDGNVRNTIAVKGTEARSGSTVRYYSGSTNITAAMRSAAGWKVTLRPRAYRLVKVQISVLRSAAIGSYKQARVSGTWTGDGARTDLAKAVVKVVR